MNFDLAARQKSNGHNLGLKLALALAAAFVGQSAPAAQVFTPEPVDFWQHPAFGKDEDISALFNGSDSLDGSPASQTPRLRMLRMLPGFLSDPPNLTAFDDPPDPFGPVGATDNGPNWMTVSFGDDNPYLDPRRPGDPGGVGFVHIHSQMALVDSASTSICFGMRGWTPAGLESGGVQQGRTVLAPGLGVFQDLGGGTALQGFVDQSLGNPAHQGPMRCGMAWNCPLAPVASSTDSGLFFSMQALGNYEYRNQGRPMNWEVVPGLHWRFSDTFTMSLGAARQSILTCWWHF